MGTIKRGHIPLDGQFTQIPNEWLRDTRLSYRARGILADIMTHADGFDVSERGLVARGAEGRDAVRAAVGELRELGYIEVTKGRQGLGKFSTDEWTITAPKPAAIEHNPTSGPLTGKPLPDNPTSANPPIRTPTKEHQPKNTPNAINSVDDPKIPIANSEAADTEIRGIVKGIYEWTPRAVLDDALAEQLNPIYEDKYGIGARDLGHMIVNERYGDRLCDLIEEHQTSKGNVRGLDYAIAQWVGTITNDYNQS